MQNGGGGCQFGPICAGHLDTMQIDSIVDTYTLHDKGSNCDQQPLSDRMRDTCGVCGGDGSTCFARFEFITSSTPVEPQIFGSFYAPAGPYVKNSRHEMHVGSPVDHCETLPTIPARRECKHYQEQLSHEVTSEHAALLKGRRTAPDVTFAYIELHGFRHDLKRAVQKLIKLGLEITEDREALTFGMQKPTANELGYYRQ